MSNPIPMVNIWRNEILESQHLGHAVICDDTGQIIQAWGDPDAVIFPRSSCKMIQALPLVESGAADRFGLTTEQLALACASHNAAAIHTDRVERWLSDLDLDDSALRCGAQSPGDRAAREALIQSEGKPCQYHNNCSGKHAGFLTMTRHLGAGPEYHEVTHPLQQAIRQVFEESTEMTSPGYGIDGCSAPNFATSMHGLARSMASFASAKSGVSARHQAEVRLVDAMIAHPDLVAGEGRACTELMRACSEPVAIKTGAEAVFVAILPNRKRGIAVKITDGATRASECAMAALLVAEGVLDPNHPATLKRMNTPMTNWRGIEAAWVRPAAGFPI